MVSEGENMSIATFNAALIPSQALHILNLNTWVNWEQLKAHYAVLFECKVGALSGRLCNDLDLFLQLEILEDDNI